jgi:uncharacterized protein
MEQLSLFSVDSRPANRALRSSLSEPRSLADVFNWKLPATLCQTARAVHPETTLADAVARVKYFVRGMSTPRLTAEWFSLLSSPSLATLVEQHPHILSKLQRPYLHRRLSRSGRLAALKNHYRLVEAHLEAEILSSIYSPGGHVLAPLPTCEAGEFTVRLFYRSQYEKEGELSLGLFDGSKASPLFTLTFCASHFGEGRSELFVGGLQGHKFENQREVVVGLTRSMHGLRPKALLVFVLQRLAQLWNFNRVLAVGDGEHIYRHLLKRKTLHAAYDEFWRECQGLRLPDGNFELPATPQSRNIAELPANKRPLYRRRYAMLASLGEEIRERLFGKRPVRTGDPEVGCATKENIRQRLTEVA